MHFCSTKIQHTNEAIRGAGRATFTKMHHQNEVIRGAGRERGIKGIKTRRGRGGGKQVRASVKRTKWHFVLAGTVNREVGENSGPINLRFRRFIELCSINAQSALWVF